MTFIDVILLGIVEGLTEFLPISSTGHMILLGHFLKIPESDQVKSFEVIIQSGAILAVVWHYRLELANMFKQALKFQQPGLEKVISIFSAFLPAAVMGLLLHKWIKATLFGFEPVVFAMIAGGLAMLAVEFYLKKRTPSFLPSHLEDPPVTLKQAITIGWAQVLAMWPGMSRSMCTMVGARLVGLRPVHAATFSFLLAIPTLFAATGFDLVKNRAILMAADSTYALQLLLGTAVSFVVALVVIRAFLGFLKKRGFEIFAWYRILFGLLLWFYLR